MMNEPRIKPIKVIDALRAEHLRRKTRSEDSTQLESVASVKNKPPQKGKSRQRSDHRYATALFATLMATI
ncbi:hypothetical protein Pst134EA_019557 [Puccinia striiformis f. sp. tritici]|uniref:hypothetical protein n=1 Tax=Puccinia striiformis f. sp. tritici TaxID=168172 RepID=UPI0020072E6B|nr:hypothetical protein Pst134EA_019557 [Puccinia striiformis f. sp. tritici]KAH9459404.1 hypothetical protein Pst134EA_019557 [Puccinia striiformis f. sp. tritici]